jgi:hypothetical protein
MTVELDLDKFLDMETEYGWKLRDVELFYGHHLVYKIPTQETGKVILPDIYKKKSVKNIVMIRGFVIRTSNPFNRKIARKDYIWDRKAGQLALKWVVREANNPIPSDVRPGDGILYMSYNVGKVKVVGMSEPLVMVREIDVVARFPSNQAQRVGLPKKAYKCVSSA